MSFERVVFDRLVTIKTSEITFADVVAVANAMTLEEKAEFAKTLMKDNCKACEFLSVRINNKIKADAKAEAIALVNNDAKTVADIKLLLKL